MAVYASGISDKKSLNMLILEILRVYTDSEHRLRQDDIIRLLEVHYGMKLDRIVLLEQQPSIY